LAAAALAASIGLALVAAIIRLPKPAIELSARVAAHLAESGVRHPVTAVLLNFRGYDTLLEVAVLLLAVLGVLALRASASAPAARPPASVSPVLAALLHLVIPLMVLAAGYLLWAGGYRAGGAFQAGAVLGGAGVLLCLAGAIPPLRSPGGWSIAALLLGFGVFLAVAAAPVAGGARLLEYPRIWAGALILLIESGLTLSIAAILTTLFAGASDGPDAAVRRGNSDPPAGARKG
jgi:multisubunit Na+/H+ antiporter MnhB subunit